MAGSDDYVEMSATYFLEGLYQGNWWDKKLPGDKRDWKLRDHIAGPNGVIEITQRSQKFSFGLRRNFYEKLELVNTTMDFFRNGIEILPYPECWFEWDNSVWNEQKSEWTDAVSKSSCLVRKRGADILFETFASPIGKCTAETLKKQWSHTGFLMVLRADGTYGHELCGASGAGPEPFDADRNNMFLSLAVMSMLMARETRIDERHPSPKLNARRIKRGRVPFFSHHIVTIDLERIAYEGGESSQADGQKRTSPRLHWRRGHVRTLSSGKKIGIPPSIIGAKNGTGPVIDKTYRVRTNHETR